MQAKKSGQFLDWGGEAVNILRRHSWIKTHLKRRFPILRLLRRFLDLLGGSGKHVSLDPWLKLPLTGTYRPLSRVIRDFRAFRAAIFPRVPRQGARDAPCRAHPPPDRPLLFPSLLSLLEVSGTSVWLHGTFVNQYLPGIPTA